MTAPAGPYARHFDVLIVGGGHAGAQAAIGLTQSGFDGSIGIVTEERELPYERPPLSKDYLAGDKPFERILIRPEAFWRDRGIVILGGERVVSVDAEAYAVVCASGLALSYGRLIWAAGGAARRLDCAGHDLAGIHTIRNRADVDLLAGELGAAKRIVVIGGGYIGLEAAAVLAKLGRAVTVLEAQDRVLARVAGAPLSHFFETEHRAHGVDIRLGTIVEAIEGKDGRVTHVRLASGDRVPADIVIVGIGIVPSVTPLIEAGAKGGNGVTVDDYCRTTLADVFAVGDCAAHANAFADGAVIRLESVQNANDQAMTVARLIARGPGDDAPPYAAVPWFWSNQYDLKLQTMGLSIGHDAVVVRGDPAARHFSVVYLKGGRVIALDCVNATRDYVQGKALVMARARIDPLLLADTAVPLKEMPHL